VTVITRRPDIRAAEERLKAANANIGVARAAFFPKLDLSAGAGLAASPFTSAATRSLSIAASLAAPIFEGGKLEGGLELSKAKKEELVEVYGKTVLTALQEVEDALAAQKAARERVKSLKNAETHARTSYEISLAQYKAGATDFQTLLSAQRDLLNARNARIGAEFSQFSASVDLFLALGG
jgi:outer membrane protein TolC